MKVSVDFSKYCIVIPAYNAEKTIEILIHRIHRHVPEIRLFVVDDGSTDNTSSIASELKNVTLLSHTVNLGKGAAIKTGIRYAAESNFSYAIFIDADLQHSPEKIKDFIIMREKKNVEMVLGTRNFTGTGMPFHRILSNSITSFVLSIRTGKRIHDSQCGYRLISLLDINIDHYRNNGFQFESEFLLKAIYSGKTYHEIQIPTIYNSTGSSSINNILDTVRFIKLFFSSYFWF